MRNIVFPRPGRAGAGGGVARLMSAGGRAARCPLLSARLLPPPLRSVSLPRPAVVTIVPVTSDHPA